MFGSGVWVQPKYSLNTNVLRLGKFQEDLYDHPSWKEPREAKFCDEECVEEFHNSHDPFSYVYCDGCDRYICRSNPGNGYQGHFRHVNDELVCDSCYESSILKNGQPREDFKESRFVGGYDFWPNDLKNNGYHIVDNWVNRKCNSRNDAEEFNRDALNLIDEYGARIITRIVPLDCFCWEASVSMYAKLPDKKENEKE